MFALPTVNGSSGLRRPEGHVRYFNLAASGSGSFESSRPTEKGVLVGGSGGTSSGVGERCDYTPTLTEADFLVCITRSRSGA